MANSFHHLSRGVLIRNGKLLVAHAIGQNNTFLPGGHIEFGESAKVTLIREWKEELGIDCTITKFLGVVEHKWMAKGILQCEVDQLFEVNCDALQDDQNPKSQEDHIEFFWLDVEKLDENNLQPFPLRKLLKNYMNGITDTWWASSLNDEFDDCNRND